MTDVFPLPSVTSNPRERVALAFDGIAARRRCRPPRRIMIQASRFRSDPNPVVAPSWTSRSRLQVPDATGVVVNPSAPSGEYRTTPLAVATAMRSSSVSWTTAKSRTRPRASRTPRGWPRRARGRAARPTAGRGRARRRPGAARARRGRRSPLRAGGPRRRGLAPRGRPSAGCTGRARAGRRRGGGAWRSEGAWTWGRSAFEGGCELDPGRSEGVSLGLQLATNRREVAAAPESGGRTFG